MATESARATADQFHIDMTKVDPALVDKALKLLKLPKDGDFEVRVQRLLTHQVEHTDPDNLAQCEPASGGCGGPSDTQVFEACPYCGMADAPEATATTSGVAPAPAAVTPASPPPIGADPKGKASAVKKATPKAKHLAAVPPPVAHAAELVDKNAISEVALDEALSRVLEAKKAGATCYWDLGTAVRDIYDRRLYTQRKDAAGKPLYASWDAFVKAELGMNKAHAFRVMDVSKAFSREDFMLVGVTKLSLIGTLEPEAQQELLDKARKGLPRGQISEEVKRLAGMGHSKKGGSGRKDPIGDKRGPGNTVNKKAPPKLASDQLTAVVTRDKIKIPLFARPKPNAKADEKLKLPRAMKVAQDPHGTYELPNGVVMHVRVVLEAKGLVLHVEHRPPADAK